MQKVGCTAEELYISTALAPKEGIRPPCWWRRGLLRVRRGELLNLIPSPTASWQGGNQEKCLLTEFH